MIGIDASRALRSRRTGTERYALEIIRHLLDLPAAGDCRWRLYVDNPPPPGLLPVQTPGAAQPNVAWSVLPARRLWTHRALAAAVHRDRLDVLFVPAHVIPFQLLPGRLPPSVVTIHDLGYHVYPDAHTRSQRLYLQASTHWSTWAARRVIAISQATAADLQHWVHVPPDKIRVIYEAVDEPTPVNADVQAEIVRRYGLVRPYALYVGTLQPRKNLERLVQAFARLVHGQAVGWDLVLAGGEGWHSERVLDAVRQAGLGDRLHLTGYVPDTDLPGLLQGAELFCFPSLFEGFGLPVLEAQSYGVPVLTSNNSALPEVAGDGAILVDPTDVDAIAAAMLRLSTDEALRQELIAAGRRNVQRFSWAKAAAETLAVLKEAAAAGRERGAP